MDDIFKLTPDLSVFLEDSHDNFLDSIRYGKEFDEEVKLDESSGSEEYVVIDDQEEWFQQGEEIKIIKTKNYIIAEEAEEMDEESNSSGERFFDEKNGFQELKLSEEEKRLLIKEGISLPSHYPLTKFEERELKRIRRKIRNKISAQDSRKRKKEFLDKLQQRVHEVEEEKSSLSKKVRTLETANAKLQAQVKRLQMALNKNNQATKTSTTTLLVLILSLALVVLPTSFGNGGVASSNRSFEVENKEFARSRTMLPLINAGQILTSDYGPVAKKARYEDYLDEQELLLLRRKRMLFQNSFHERIIDDKNYD